MLKNGIVAKLVIGSAILAGSTTAHAAPNKEATHATAPKPMYGTFGVDVAGMDTKVKPGDDFNAFVNGVYLKNLEIPADKSTYGMFNNLRDLSQARTRGIVEAAAAKKNAKPGSEAQKVGDFYSSFLDEATIETKGITPLKPELDAIQAITDRTQLSKAFGKAMRQGVNTPLGISPQQDLKNPEVYAIYVGQGGLGLPDREYYLDLKNAKFSEIRDKYLIHIAAMLRLAGFDNVEAKAKGIFALETKLAEVHWSKIEERQVEKAYNPVKRVALEAAYPGVEWTSILTAVGVQAQPELIMTAPSAILGSCKLIASEPLDTWKDYLAFHTLKAGNPGGCLRQGPCRNQLVWQVVIKILGPQRHAACHNRSRPGPQARHHGRRSNKHRDIPMSDRTRECRGGRAARGWWRWVQRGVSHLEWQE